MGIPLIKLLMPIPLMWRSYSFSSRGWKCFRTRPGSSCFQFSSVQFSSFQSLSRVRLFATPWIAAPQASLFITISWSSLRLTSIESVMPPSHLILSRPLLPASLPASESFLMSQPFAWGGQSTGVSALASFLPKQSQGWSSEWTGWGFVNHIVSTAIYNSALVE